MTSSRWFERLLWASRFLILIAVVLSIVAAIAMLYVASTDTIALVAHIVPYADPHLAEAAREQLHASAVAQVAAIMDSYLFAAILIIFALGLYELFIGKIELAERNEVASRLLLIRNLDDLKERLGKVLFLILVVRYFQFVLKSPPNGPLDLLFLAVGIALVAGALYVTSRHG